MHTYESKKTLWTSFSSNSRKSALLRRRSALSSSRFSRAAVARVALAWVRMQPGVSSTIIGARRLAQLGDNLQSTEITLNAEDLAHIDRLTKPVLPFPQNMQPMFPAIHNGGTTVNGVTRTPSPFVIGRDKTPY